MPKTRSRLVETWKELSQLSPKETVVAVVVPLKEAEAEAEVRLWSFSPPFLVRFPKRKTTTGKRLSVSNGL